MSQRTWTRAAVATACLVLASNGVHARAPLTHKADASTAPTPPAPQYLRMASSGDLFEIQSSQLALQVSRDPGVKAMAQMIIDDHMRLSTELKTAAAGAGIAPPMPMLAPHHQRQLVKLRGTAAARFDAAYRQAQVAAHQEALRLHQAYAANGDVAALRIAARGAVPVIQGHLRAAQGANSQADHAGH